MFEKKTNQTTDLQDDLSTRDNEIEETAQDKEDRLKKELKQKLVRK